MNLKEYFVKASKGIKKRFDQNKQRNEILFNSLELQDHEISIKEQSQSANDDDDIVNMDAIIRKKQTTKRQNTSSRDRIKPDSNNYENISLLMDFESRNSKLSSFGVSADSARPQTGISNKIKNKEKLMNQLNCILKGKVFKYGEESDIMIIDGNIQGLKINKTVSKFARLNHSSEQSFKRPMTTNSAQRYNTISNRELKDQSASRNSSKNKQSIPSKRSSRIMRMTKQTQRGARIGNDGYMKIIRDEDVDDFTPRAQKRLPPPPFGQTMRHQQFLIK